jgi:hypothetical protein
VRAWQQRGCLGVDKPSTPATTAENNMKPSGGARDDVSAGAHAASAAAPSPAVCVPGRLARCWRMRSGEGAEVSVCPRVQLLVRMKHTAPAASAGGGGERRASAPGVLPT